MERRKRRKYTPEYKAEVVRLVETGNKSIAQLSSELELTESAVRAWVERATIDEKKDPNDRMKRGHAECNPTNAHVRFPAIPPL